MHRTVRHCVTIVALVGLFALAACGDDPVDAPDPASDTTSAGTSPPAVGPVPGSPSPAPAAPSPSGGSSATPTASGPPAWEELATGFTALSATMVDPRTDDLLVVELEGRIAGLDGTVVLDLTDRVTVGSEQGLLDATPSPDGTRLIVHYSGDGGRTVLSSFAVSDDPSTGLADAAAETRLLTFEQPASNHNGGSVVFGPDGWLYLALGDGGQANDAFGNGADPGTPLGAILRLDVTSDPAVAVPAPDNPFLDGGGDPMVWAHGLRNPWRIATDGQRWFVADVGQDAVEEVSIVPATPGPHDLGWPEWEGDFCRVDVCEDDSIQPVATLSHTDGACSVIGAAVADAPAVDRGRFFFTDLCDTRVWQVDPATGTVTEDVALPDEVRPLALDTDGQGHVLALTSDGRVLRRVRS
ncbi:PQQ-dependent sugar dehydrogenase [Salsipaludibacter albus]|uniref:PQQ-dependent sugar dehydrogenase n=1 Tax=Salsipaludibacter albus TaxID=2849650 RepID=UPI001EE3F74A|nr:PQQ-dependent sugar dehydrogenase [Salsipaludibacter albus]MBY5161759.1 PQQ-dependent sugar dehydrogenase [Salsipaludibacter albus]